jgi:ornithine decarboxylase
VIPTAVNLGGGFPTGYRDAVAPLAEYAAAITAALAAEYGADVPAVLIEPGRAVVADAGVLRAEVVLAARRSTGDERRWVYLDAGRYNGLAETENEAIAYRLATRHDPAGPTGPVVLAGPTCDGDDVLYQRTPYRLPLALTAGDHVDILSAGAYSASYASVGFNGFPPLRTYCVRAGGSGEIVPVEQEGTAMSSGSGTPETVERVVGTFGGRHVLAEFGGVAADRLDDVAFLRDRLEDALRAAGATVCEVVARRFAPQGVTVLALLSESHASLHTYPERGSLFLDVFTCGRRADPERAVRLLAADLGAAHTEITTIQRGTE